MKFTKIFAVALAAVAMVACSKEPNGGTKSGGSATIEVKLNTGTRALTGTEDGVGDEIKINKLEFYMFDATSGVRDGDGTTDFGYFVQSSAATVARFVVEAGDKKFVVAVNQNLGNLAGLDYADVVKVVNGLNLTNSNSQTAPTEYAMSGEGRTTIVAESNQTITIDVKRLISKVRAPKLNATNGGSVEFTTAKEEEYLQELFGLDAVTNLAWEFDGYVVINGVKQSYALPYNFSNTWVNPVLAATVPGTDGWFKTAYTDATGAEILTVYGGTSAGDKFIAKTNTGVVFVYENVPTRTAGSNGSASTYAKDEVTALLIKGTFSCDEAADAVRYWRVNLIKDDSWKVYRNSIYDIEIGRILTPGYETPKEAEEEEEIYDPNETVIEAKINILPWDVRFQGVDL